MAEPFQPSDQLTAVIAAWVNFVVLQLDQQKLDVVRRCLDDEGTDVRVVVTLRASTVALEAIKVAAGQKFELFVEHVAPLRPDTGFATDTSSRKQ
jgi:hypothetical protein